VDGYFIRKKEKKIKKFFPCLSKDVAYFFFRSFVLKQKNQKFKTANHLLQNYDIKIPAQYKP